MKLAADARLIDAESCVIDCKVIDLSATGARLEVPWRSRIPSHLTLCIPGQGIERPVEVVWSSKDEVGVHFLFETIESSPAPVLRQTAAPAPIVIEPSRASAPVPRKVDKLRDLATHSQKRSSFGAPTSAGSMFRVPGFFLAFLVIGIFCAAILVWSKSGLHISSTKGGSFDEETGRLSASRSGLNSGQTDGDPNFTRIHGLGSTLLNVFGRGNNRAGEKSDPKLPADDPAIGQTRPSAPAKSQDLEPPGPQMADTANPHPAVPLGPAAFQQSAVRGLAGEADMRQRGASGRNDAVASVTRFAMAPILSVSRLDPSELQTVETCLAAVMKTRAIEQQESLPRFVFANTCLQRPSIVVQEPPQQANSK